MPPRRRFRDRLPSFPRPQALPSLYDRHPRAASALRRPRGLRIVPIDRIVGTVRHPTQNTTDFLPLPEQRGRNWEARWQRILQATDDLSILPAIDLVQVGDEYYVADGHNRVAAALSVGAVAIDADVTELVMPGEAAAHTDAPPSSATSILLGADEVRQAAAGRQSRTVEQRSRIDELRRDELTGHPEVEAAEPSDQADE